MKKAKKIGLLMISIINLIILFGFIVPINQEFAPIDFQIDWQPVGFLQWAMLISWSVLLIIIIIYFACSIINQIKNL